MDTHDLLDAARSLSTAEQLELLQGLAQSVAQALMPADIASNEFWRHTSIEELAQEQDVHAIADISSLIMPDWPRDELADDLIGHVHSQREEDRAY